jgi:hypothetical protein
MYLGASHGVTTAPTAEAAEEERRQRLDAGRDGETVNTNEVFGLGAAAKDRRRNCMLL